MASERIEGWVSDLKFNEPHDYSTLLKLAIVAHDKANPEPPNVARFVEYCLYKYGGSKEFAVLEYCANNMS